MLFEWKRLKFIFFSCEQNKNFTTFVTTISVQNNNGVQFTLGGLMIQPVQVSNYLALISFLFFFPLLTL